MYTINVNDDVDKKINSHMSLIVNHILESADDVSTVVLTGGFGTILGIIIGAVIFGIAKEAFFYIPGIDGSFYRVFLGLVIVASAITNENIRKRIMGSI